MTSGDLATRGPDDYRLRAYRRSPEGQVRDGDASEKLYSKPFELLARIESVPRTSPKDGFRGTSEIAERERVRTFPPDVAGRVGFRIVDI